MPGAAVGTRSGFFTKCKMGAVLGLLESAFSLRGAALSGLANLGEKSLQEVGDPQEGHSWSIL